MATHDYVIANGTGAAVRSDLNNALAAIVSNNSSSTEPGTTYAYQWWADTNANVLKIRNSANDGWITLRELDGTMLIEDGSAASPGLSFADDTNTGIFSPENDAIAFATGGVERFGFGTSEIVFNNPGNDIDFRVESDGDTHMLFVDAGNDRVGIGESAPDQRLHVKTSSDDVAKLESTSGGNGPNLTFTHTGASPADNDTVGKLTFAATNDNSEDITFADIKVISTDVSDGSEDADFTFSTRNNGTFAERVRLDSSGNIGVGATPSAWGGSRNAIQFDSAGAAYLCNDSTMGIVSNFYFDGSANKYLTTAAAAAIYVQNGNIHFDIAPSGTAGNSATFNTRVRIDDNGLKFNDDTAVANALDDYEEGTFTPTYLSGLSSPSYSDTTGTYTKIGNLVTFTLRISATGSNVGSHARIGSLPFTSSSSKDEGSASFGFFSNLTGNQSDDVYLHIPDSATNMEFYYASGAQFLGNGGNGLSGRVLHIRGFYYV